MAVKKRTSVALYVPKVSLGVANKYDVYLTVEWGFYKRTTKISREYPDLLNRVVNEIGTALAQAAETQPYELK